MSNRRDAFEYDVALSFAEADKATAGEVADLLSERKMDVFLDEYKSSDVWGKDVLDHLVNLYARKARYCVLLISQHYPLKTWTKADRTSVQELALRDADEYILPIRLDDTEVPGISDSKGYWDLHQHSLADMVNLLEGKLSEEEDRPGPPPQSHDLRSGNVPSSRDE